MSFPYTIIIEQGVDGYLIGSVLELPGCRTQAKTYDELLVRMKEAIELYRDENNEDEEIPRFVGIQKLEVYA